MRLFLRTLGRNKVVASYAAVADIFDRPADFQNGYTIAPKAKLGTFLLSLDVGPRHTREKRALKRAIEKPFERFAQIAERESWAMVATLAGGPGETIELGSTFAERVYIRTIAQYFGVPLEGWHSKHLDTTDSERTLALFIRMLGATIGSSASPAPFGLEELAGLLSREFEAQLAEVLGQHCPTHPESVIGYLVDPRPDPSDEREPREILEDAKFVQQDGLARSIGGLMCAGAGFPKAFCHALHELLSHGKLRELAEHAREPELDPAAWQALVRAYVLEALRFRPVFPALQRYCPRSASVAGREIAAGSTVVFSPLGAMFDRTHVDRPDEFRPGRPDDNYFVFGGGPRACLGQNMMLSLFPPMLLALLRTFPGLARAAPGTFEYDTTALESYRLRLPERAALEELPPRSFERTGAHEEARPKRAPDPVAAARRLP
jgi:cytochrome P450